MKIPFVHCGLWFLTAVAGLGACSTTPESLTSAPSVKSTPSGLNDVPGYVHNFSRSRFRIGEKVLELSEFGFDKRVGSEGVFATIRETGWVLAIPNASSPATLVGPFSSSPDANNAAVRRYFVDAGLPEAQIDHVSAHANMHGSGHSPQGASVAKALASDPVLDGYTSILSRAVSGVPVPDSFAWARFNANGDVVEEQVYWPSIPANTVQNALKLQVMLASSTQTILSTLPPQSSSGRVTIRHSPGSQRDSFESFASVDVLERGLQGMGRVRHFDEHGVEMTLASERVSPPEQAIPRP